MIMQANGFFAKAQETGCDLIALPERPKKQ
jgi:hypothetical protein